MAEDHQKDFMEEHQEVSLVADSAEVFLVEVVLHDKYVTVNCKSKSTKLDIRR